MPQGAPQLSYRRVQRNLDSLDHHRRQTRLSNITTKTKGAPISRLSVKISTRADAANNLALSRTAPVIS